jgi:hypothetical protein
VSSITVVLLACGILALFLWRVWFVTQSPNSRIRLQARRKHWRFEEDRAGLWYKIEGIRAGLRWSAEWNARESPPYFELAIPDQRKFDGWCFISRRERQGKESMKLLAAMFTEKAQPNWLPDWLHARVQLTGIPDFDDEYVLSSSRPLVQDEFPSVLVSQLRALPAAIIQNLLVIRGQGRLRLRIDQPERIDPIEMADELASFAQQALANWKI